MAAPIQDRTAAAAANIPLADLESATSSAPGHASQLPLPNITVNGSAKPPRDDWDWLDYIEDFWHSAMIALVPSFLQPYVGGKPAEPAKLHAIAALDGLRGWACMLVFHFHFFFTYTYTTSMGWGFGGENFYLHQLPFVHMLVSGHIMVAIFFVLSGYVLSYKPLKTARNQSFDQTFTTLASSTFRRALRLYIPPFVGLACIFTAVRMGLYNYSWVVIKEGHTVVACNEEHPPIFKTTYEQAWDLYYTVARLINIFDYSIFYNNYNPHLWTIPIEFRSSLILFMIILGTSRLKTGIRLFISMSIIWFCTRYGRWDVVLFLVGMLLAEIDLINGTWERPAAPATILSDDKTHIRFNGGKFMISISRRTVWLTVFAVGLYFGSLPNMGFKWTPGYMWLWDWTPYTYDEPHRFGQTIGAGIIVFSINHSPDIQKLFTNPLSQYLGKISFAFYIVHGPILHCLGYAVMPNIWSYTGKDTDFQFCFGFFLGYIILLPICICAGDFFWRFVDIPSVKLARWVENRVVVAAAVQGQPSAPPPPARRTE